jgi:hypothetical protein
MRSCCATLEHEPARRYQQALVGLIIAPLMFVFGLTVPVILLAVPDMDVASFGIQCCWLWFWSA